MDDLRPDNCKTNPEDVRFVPERMHKSLLEEKSPIKSESKSRINKMMCWSIQKPFFQYFHYKTPPMLYPWLWTIPENLW